MSDNPLPNNTKESVAKKGIKHIDAVVTGVILWGIIASIYGVSKLRDKEVHTSDHETHLIETPKEIERRSFWKRIFGKK